MENKLKTGWIIEKGDIKCVQYLYPEQSKRVWKSPADLARAIKLDLFLTNSKLRYDEIDENFVFGWFMAVSQIARSNGQEIVLTGGTLRDIVKAFKEIC